MFLECFALCRSVATCLIATVSKHIRSNAADLSSGSTHTNGVNRREIREMRQSNVTLVEEVAQLEKV